MLDLTMYMLVGAVLFFILSIIFKSGGKLDIMSLLLGVLALASVMQDEEIVDADLIYYILPLFYLILMSALGFVTAYWKEKS